MSLSFSIVGSGDSGVSLIRVYEADDSLTTVKEDPSRWVDQASDLLHQQWPRGGQAATYREKVIHSYSSSNQYYGLPCSYVIVKADACIG
jgi:hypothetical protein